MSKYTNWNEEAQSFADQMQISVRDLTEVLAEIGNINFAVQAQRTQALDMYGNMTRTHVVAHDKQFPQFATYITMQMGDYAQIQAQLVTALSYKEASEHRNDPVQTEKPNPRQQLRTSDSHSTGVLMNFNSTDDAKVSFFQAIRNFNIQLGRTGATIGRKTFEAKFGLEWK